MAFREIRLEVPNDIRYLPIILGNVSGIADMTGFKKGDISAIELGTEEAVSNVIKHAFNPDEKVYFSVIIQPETLGLRIIIKEKGIPFDSTLIPQYKPEDLSMSEDIKGLGTYLMKQFIDEVKFCNLGKEGKETHLFKYMTTQSIDRLMNQSELETAEKEKKAEKLPKNSIHFDVRRMAPDEAVEVSKGAYSSYGYSYVLEHIYFPDRVREMNQQDELISFVAVTESEVIGHCALEVEEADPKVPQLGVAFTKPKYRGQGCLNRLADACLEEARIRNFTAVYARGITTHPYSQKSLLNFNMLESAICLSSGPEREYKGIEGKPQRESVVLHQIYIHPPKELVIHPPVRHEQMVREIFTQLGVEPKIKSATGDFQIQLNESVIAVIAESHNQVGKISVSRYGKDIEAVVYQQLKRLCIDRMETVYLYLKLNDPLTAALAERFEQMGFFFSGVMPGSEGRDVLILQYLNNYVIDFDKLAIAGDMGKKILEYIKKEIR